MAFEHCECTFGRELCYYVADSASGGRPHVRSLMGAARLGVAKHKCGRPVVTAGRLRDELGRMRERTLPMQVSAGHR